MKQTKSAIPYVWLTLGIVFIIPFLNYKATQTQVITIKIEHQPLETNTLQNIPTASNELLGSGSSAIVVHH